MTLPKISLPTYEVTLPSSGKKVNIRPFLVKEEKLLLMALESKDNDEIIKTTIQVIQNCLVDKKIDASKLAFFDVDYLFIALRAKSVGESIDVKFSCNVGSPVCGNTFKAQIDISNCTIVKDDAITKDIGLGNNVIVKMRYPTYAELKSINSNDNEIDKKIRLISACMDMIVNGDSVLSRKDFSAEVSEFLENLTKSQFIKLEKFVDNLPSFVVNAKAKCDKCGTVHEIEYDDFESFFV